MAIDEDPYAQAMLALHKSLVNDIAMLRAAFARDALISGRHTPESLADILETAKGMEGYEGSPTEIFVKMLRDGGPSLTLIRGGLAEE